MPHLQERHWRFGGLRHALPSEEAAGAALPGLHAMQHGTRRADAEACSRRCTTLNDICASTSFQTSFHVQLAGSVRIGGAAGSQARRVHIPYTLDARGGARAPTPVNPALRRNSPSARAACAASSPRGGRARCLESSRSLARQPDVPGAGATGWHVWHSS